MGNLKFYTLGALTLGLSGYESYATILNALAYGNLNILHAVFLTLGLVGAVFCFIEKLQNFSKWLMSIFYLVQVVFIYGETFVFKFFAGFAFPLHWFKPHRNGIEETLNNPVGIGFNLFAMIMFFLVFKLLKAKPVT